MTARKLALDPPKEDLALLTRERLDEAAEASRHAPRGRMVAPLHRSMAEPLQRMFNAIQPHSYVHPHRHLRPPKPEVWIVLRGRVLFVTFHDDGTIDKHVAVAAGEDVFGVDLVPGRYHTLVALTPDAIIYEAKAGPYEPMSDKEFAPWAPQEGSAEAASFLANLLERCGYANTTESTVSVPSKD